MPHAKQKRKASSWFEAPKFQVKLALLSSQKA